MRTISLFIFLLLPFCSLALKPKAEYIATPDNYGITYKQYTITNDGVALASWLLTPQEHAKNEYILISTSDFGNMSYSLMIANELYKKGYGVILYDYRGFGKSSPFAVDTNRLFYPEFVADLDHVYGFYKHMLGNDKTIHFLSYSMGTAVTAQFLEKQKVQGKVIFDGFIDSVSAVCRNLKVLKNRDFTSPVPEAAYQQSISRLSRNHLLIFVGLKDQVCQIDPASAFITRQKNWQVQTYDGGHMQGFPTLTKNTPGDVYIADIENFLGSGH